MSVYSIFNKSLSYTGLRLDRENKVREVPVFARHWVSDSFYFGVKTASIESPQNSAHNSKAYQQALRQLGKQVNIGEAADPKRPLPMDTLKRMISALTDISLTDLESAAGVQKVSQVLEEKCWMNPLDSVQVIKQTDLQQNGLQLTIYVPKGHGITSFIVHPETGKSFKVNASECKEASHRLIDGQSLVQLKVKLAAQAFHSLPMGYHRLEIEDLKSRPMRLVVTPSKMYNPIASDKKGVFALTLQLYGLRHAKDWGIGDFTALKETASWMSKKGGAAVGVTPLHALNLLEPSEAFSPYNPMSRQFLNLIYIDVHAVPEFNQFQADTSFKDEKARIETLHQSDWVNYPAVTDLKLKILKEVFNQFLLKGFPSRKAAFQTFVERYRQPDGSNLLTEFATFQTLQKHFQGKPLLEWSESFHSPESSAIQGFKKDHEAEVDFYQYLQWISFEQLDSVRPILPLGTYQDLAVGMDPSSFEIWRNPSLCSLKLRVGNMPEALSPEGQNWGFPLEKPLALREMGYQPLINRLRANMKGIMRLDHAYQLKRLFTIPETVKENGQERLGKPRDGAFVYYPVDEMMGILALESHRNQSAVIAEDVGVYWPEFTKKMHEWGLFGYDMQPWDREWDEIGQPFKNLAYVRRNAARANTSHDFPATVELLDHTYPVLLHQLNGINLINKKKSVEKEEEVIWGFTQWLKEWKHLPENFGETASGQLSFSKVRSEVKSLIAALYKAMSQARSAMVLVELKDLLPDHQLIANIPGTLAGPKEIRGVNPREDDHLEENNEDGNIAQPTYPNWRQRYPHDWKEDAFVHQIMDQLKSSRGLAQENLVNTND